MTSNTDSVNVVICTKDRPHHLLRQLHQLRDIGLFRHVTVVDSSIKLDHAFYRQSPIHITLIHTPNATLGTARQAGLLWGDCPFTFYVDDDIRFTRDSFLTLYHRFIANTGPTAAMSGIIVYGYPQDTVLMKLFKSGRSIEGHSNGYCLLDNAMVLEVGGFNPKIHIGEDFDLATRLRQHGYQWIRCKESLCYHAATLREMIWKAFRAGQYFYLGRRHPIYWFGRLMGKLLLMPTYYAITGKDPRIFIYYTLMNAARLYGYAWSYHHADPQHPLS
jgi:glycosyltransferase involved in cell wall biosynthesis